MEIEINHTINDFLKRIKKTEYFSKIGFIILYGSHLDNYHFNDSDIDICIYIEGEKKDLAQIRLNLLKIFNEKFDIQIFQLLPIFVQIEVLKGKILYVRDENLLYEVANSTIEEFEDFYPFYSDYIN
ncbi:MAG: nucleotidyltransferase domain-containing protein [Candidatus Helarchaeota archaeon]